jgi:hypothetical protein
MTAAARSTARSPGFSASISIRSVATKYSLAFIVGPA